MGADPQVGARQSVFPTQGAMFRFHTVTSLDRRITNMEMNMELNILHTLESSLEPTHHRDHGPRCTLSPLLSSPLSRARSKDTSPRLPRNFSV